MASRRSPPRVGQRHRRLDDHEAPPTRRFALGESVTRAMRRLGYPSRQTLYHWLICDDAVQEIDIGVEVPGTAGLVPRKDLTTTLKSLRH